MECKFFKSMRIVFNPECELIDTLWNVNVNYDTEQPTVSAN